MMINKNRFRVSNDKKVLHKIGKRWVTVSALTLALLGGGALAGSVTTHADTNQPQTEQAKQQPSATPKGIMKTASALHANVLANAQKPASSASAKSSVASQSASSASSKASSSNDAMNTLTLGPAQQKRGWNFVQNGVRNNDFDNTKPSATSSSSSATQSASSSASASSVAPSNSVSASAKPSFNSAYRSYMAQMSGTDSEVASTNAGDVQSDKKNVKKSLLKDNAQPNYFSGTIIRTGNDSGLNYKVWSNGGVEFTGGTADSYLDFSDDFNFTVAIKFDDDINTSKVTNMSGVFNSDSHLRLLDLGNNFDTHNVTDMNHMFNNDSDLQSLVLPESFNTSKVTNMNSMFQDDGRLQSLVLPNSFDTSKVSDMSGMFNNNSNLQSLVLPKLFNTGNVTNMNSMFDDDGSLQSLVLPDSFDTGNVTNMNSMFSNEFALQSLTLPNAFKTNNVTSMDSMFNNDTKLQSLTLSNNFNTSKVTDMGNMFSGDSSLRTVILPDTFDTSNVTNMSSMFSDDSLLQSLTLPALFNTTKANENNGLMAIFNGTGLNKLSIVSSKSLNGLMNAAKSGQVISGFDYPAWFNKAYQKDTNDNYTSATPVNLADGKSHVGTWLKTANPKKLPEAAPYGVVYLNQNKTEVGQATLSNLGYVGQTVNVEPQLAANVPRGYHLDNTNPINVTLNDGGIINVDTSNGVGAADPIHHGMLGGMLKDSPANTDNHVITVDGNPITYKGNVTLNFKANGKTIKTITKPYSVNTYTGDTVNLLNPASYLDGSDLTDNNNNPITINNTYFTPDGSNNPETVTVQPSDAPQTSGNTKTNNSYVLNYNANNVNDNITYDLSGSNVPSNYQGQTGRLNGTSLNGVYDTNVPLSALNADVPTNYHIVSGNNIRYDNGSHTVELAPDSENVNVTYTDQNGKTYVGSVNGQYDQKINDITNNYSLPSGYHVNAGQDNSYTFNGNQNQSKALNITGNTQKGDVTVISKKYDGSTYEGETSKTIHESGDTGNGFTINPTDSQFTPDGYSSQSEQYNGTFTPTGLSTNKVVFNYKAGAGTAISVTYTNQHGANVGSGMVTGNTDDRGAISSQVPVPNGYTVNGGQPSQYHILAGAQNPINIKVTGKPVNELNGQGKFTITINKHIGSKVVPSTKVIQVSGKVGDTFTVTPSNYTPNAKGYTSTTHPIQSTITPNGLAQSSATFDYTANTGDPINVTYKNQAGKVVGNGSFTGVVDQTGDITSYVKVPSDYTLNGGQNTSFTTTLNDQSMTLNVTGKSANATINFINQDGQQIGSASVSGKAGDTVSPSSYPKGYEVPSPATKYTFNKSGQNPDENNVQLTGDIAGDINRSKAKNAPKTAADGYVTVHVVEKSTSGKVLHKFDKFVSENLKRVGDPYTVNPSDESDYDNDNSGNALTGTINNDGSVSNGQTTFNYTVHASDIEPISITVKNQNGHYIDLSTGKLTNSVDDATSTISDDTLAKLGGVGDNVDITNYINAPKGYHINGNKSAIEDVKGQKLDAITLEHKKVGLSAEPLMLALWTPAPKPNSSTNKPASSANVKPSSSASAKPSSASVAPSSSASVAPSSASVAPSSASSVAPSNASSAASSQSVAPSSAAQSTSTSYVEPSGNTPEPVSASTSATPVRTPSDVTPVPSDITPVKPAVHKHTTPSEPAKVTKPSDKIVNKNVGGNAKTEVKPATEVSRHAAKVQHEAASHMANVGNMMAQPTAHAADIHASHVNAGSVQHQSTQHKLPQTNEAKAAGLMGASAIMAALGLAGADTDRKRRRN